MSGKKVLLAGATGAVGFEVLKKLHASDVDVYTLSRSRQKQTKLAPYVKQVHIADASKPASLRGICGGMDVVVSCMGASLALNLQQRASYHEVDYLANLHLLQEAQRAGVSRFVYVSVYPGAGYDHTRYVKAHLAMEEAIQTSGLSYSIVRPSGLFIAMEEFLKMAKRGLVPLIGDGSAQSNPVDHREVAGYVVDYLYEGPSMVSIGGPEVMTRKQIALCAFQSVGKTPKFVHVPAWFFRMQSFLLRWIHPRLSELLEFAAAVSTVDAFAPQVGKQTLSSYFQQQLESKRP